MFPNPLLKPLEKSQLGDKPAKICSPEAPRRLKEAVAKGLAPGLSQEETLTALYQLAVTDDELAPIIEKTILATPESILAGTAAKEDLPPPVLWMLAGLPLPEPVQESIIKNRATPGEALAQMAKVVRERLTLILVDNQRRLLEYPPIIEALYMNKHTPMSAATKIIELNLEAYHEMLKALDMDPPSEEDPIDAELAAAELDQKFLTMENTILALPDDDDEETDELIDKETPEEEINKRIILSQLPISARIRLAMLGNRFHRAQLIRDSNKVVSMAAIKSPSITDTEVDEYSKNKSISEDVIRYIARRKDWLKSYRIKVNLVNNPKTPITVALTLLNFLRKNDLRSLSRSRNIPQVIRTAALQRLRQRN